MTCGSEVSECLQECVHDNGTTDRTKLLACSKVCNEKAQPCLGKCEKEKKAGGPRT
jgi:hypothetical protein